MDNTRITYLYRDGCNCKQEETAVVAGALAFAQLLPCLDEGRYFAPGDVGLPHPQRRWAGRGYPFPTDNDHPWAELGECDLSPTDEPPTLPLTATELLARFRAAHAGGWPAARAWPAGLETGAGQR